MVEVHLEATYIFISAQNAVEMTVKCFDAH